MSQTIAAPYPTLTATTTFNDNVYYSLAHQVREGFVVVGVLCGLYGVLIVLSVLSINALIQRSRRISPTAIVLSSAILILFASTTIYMITTILFYLSQFLINLIAADLYTDGDDVVDLVPEYLVQDYSPLRACASTATLTVNVVLGDAIVCWRACVVWHQNRYVKAFCGLFLLATLILGAVNTASGCGPEAFYKSFNLNTGVPQGTMFEGLPIGIAACVLSLSTNILATALVGQKEWQSRRRLRKYFAGGPRGSQVGKLFSLLIESGAMYCAIWIVVVAFEVRTYKLDTWLSSNPTGVVYRFLDAFGIFLNGVLVPVIAIYPTLIIVIVALNRSHIEKGITQHMDSLPTPRIAAATTASDTIAVASLRVHRSPGSGSGAEFASEAAIDDSDRCASERGYRWEDNSTRTSGEPKAERIV